MKGREETSLASLLRTRDVKEAAAAKKLLSCMGDRRKEDREGWREREQTEKMTRKQFSVLFCKPDVSRVEHVQSSLAVRMFCQTT